MFPPRALPRDFKWNVLKAIHDFGYVYKDGLAQLFRLHPVTICRVVDQSVADGFVRLAGYAVGCPYPAFHHKYIFDRKRVAIVMYGDEGGCNSACEGLNADLFWQPPKWYLKV